MKAAQTTADGIRKLPLMHRCIGGLASFLPLAILPALLLIWQTGSAAAGTGLAFVINSLLTILFYREDKYRAQRNCWRIPERTLHIWAFLCGWPGALYAQQAYRHKRKKLPFMAVFFLCMAANVLILYVAFFPGHTAAIRHEWKNWLQEKLLPGD